MNAKRATGIVQVDFNENKPGVQNSDGETVDRASGVPVSNEEGELTGGATETDYEGEMLDLFGEYLAMQTGIAAAQMAIAADINERANEQWDIYKETYLPGEMEFIESSYAGIPVEQELSWASAGVNASFDKAESIQERDLARMGIDPTSGAYAQTKDDAKLARAAAEAGASNEARRNVRDVNYERERQATTIGRGIPTTASGISTQAASIYGSAGSGLGSAYGTGIQAYSGAAGRENQRDIAWQQNSVQRDAIESAEDRAMMDMTGDIFTGMGALCWVAREVYGSDSPMWKRYRVWLLTKAPRWFRALYIAFGEPFAAWLRDKPWLKRRIRTWMDARIATGGC